MEENNNNEQIKLLNKMITPEMLVELMNMRSKINHINEEDRIKQKELLRLKTQPIINGMADIINESDYDLEIISYGISTKQLKPFNEITDQLNIIILDLLYGVKPGKNEGLIIKTYKINDISDYIRKHTSNFRKELGIKWNYGGLFDEIIISKLNGDIKEIRKNEVLKQKENEYKLYSEELQKLNEKWSISTNPFYIKNNKK